MLGLAFVRELVLELGVLRLSLVRSRSRFATAPAASPRWPQSVAPLLLPLLEIEVAELLSVGVAHHKAGGLFFDRSGSREAEIRH
jgi:hypothetical protein